MIGVVVPEIAFLKVLTPIMLELHRAGIPYILYHSNHVSAGKEYARPTRERLIKLVPESVNNASQISLFKDNKDLLRLILKHKVKKIVSLEVWLCFRKILGNLRQHRIKTYSLQYLTDSVLQPVQSITEIDRVYYMSDYIMGLHHQFAQVKFNPNRDRCLGSPLFDPIIPSQGSGDILVLTPNIRPEHVKSTFGGEKNFVEIVKKLSKAGDLIFKTRRKQWLPEAAKKHAKLIVDDSQTIYPPATTDIFKNCHTTVLFYSTGIYEAVYANNWVLNIKLRSFKFSRLVGDQKTICVDQENGAYRFDGVSKSIDQDELLRPDWKFKPQKIDPARRLEWVKRFVGGNGGNSAKLIVFDIIK